LGIEPFEAYKDGIQYLTPYKKYIGCFLSTDLFHTMTKSPPLTDIEDPDLFGFSTNIYNRSVIALENNSSRLAIQYGTDRDWTFFVMNYET